MSDEVETIIKLAKINRQIDEIAKSGIVPDLTLISKRLKEIKDRLIQEFEDL